MLCSRIRLNERRFRVISAMQSTQTTMPEPVNELTANDGPFVRPCAMPNVVNGCSSPTTAIGNGTDSSSIGETSEVPTVENTPRSSRSFGRYYYILQLLII